MDVVGEVRAEGHRAVVAGFAREGHGQGAGQAGGGAAGAGVGDGVQVSE